MTQMIHTPPTRHGFLLRYPGLVATIFATLVLAVFVGALALDWRHSRSGNHPMGEPMEREMRGHRTPEGPPRTE